MVGSARTGTFLQLAALLLAAGGAYLAYGEARPYFQGGVLAKERFEALYNGKMEPGYSSASTRLVLDSCLDAITSIYGRTQASVRREETARACLNLADAATRYSPTLAYGWFIGAIASEGLGDIDGMATRLARSAATAPNEQWIAELRWPLFERHYAGIAAEDQPLVANDIVLLLRSPRGTSLVTDRYVRADDTTKARIEAVVETTSDSTKQRFISKLQVSARQVSP
jgi:hypothetical protein